MKCLLRVILLLVWWLLLIRWLWLRILRVVFCLLLIRFRVRVCGWSRMGVGILILSLSVLRMLPSGLRVCLVRMRRSGWLWLMRSLLGMVLGLVRVMGCWVIGLSWWILRMVGGGCVWRCDGMMVKPLGCVPGGFCFGVCYCLLVFSSLSIFSVSVLICFCCASIVLVSCFSIPGISKQRVL